MLEALFALLFEGFGEIFMQAIVEIVFRTLFSFITPDEYRLPKWAGLIGWICIGATAGLISVLVFPDFLIRWPAGRIASLILMPVLLGIFTWTFGRFQDARDRLRLPLDSFWYGYGFSFAFLIVRLMAAR